MPHNQGALDTIDAQLQSLAAEESRHLDEIRRIQQRRETLSIQRAMIQSRRTVYSLPTEILLHIFRFVVQWDARDWQDGEEVDWRPVVLSHVCATWRAAIMATSSLWVCLDFSRYPAVRPLIARSREQPVDVVHGMQPLPGYKHDTRFEAVLQSTSVRWRSLLWESTELRMTDVLAVLNSGAPFPHLRRLELGIAKRTLPGVPLNPAALRDATGQSLLPSLERICLSSISLSELPPTPLPSLSSLTLHFPAKYPSTRANLLRMSSLCAVLSRAPELKTLVFSDSTPLMDVFVRWQAGISEDADQASLPANHIIPLSLPTLRRFEWSHAPPKDLWRFLAIIRMLALKELELYLDSGDRRWYTFYASVLEPMGDEPLSPRPLHPVIQLEELEELVVFATDVDGLCAALRTMTFPKLRKLTLGHLAQRASRLWRSSHPRDGPYSIPVLPSQESVFREPRMLTLSQLTLSNFRLERQSTILMLAYMHNLEELTIESCIDANTVVCALSGTASCKESIYSGPRRWTCPRLRHLILIECSDLKLNCLKHTVLARKERGTSINPDRPVKPLRRLRRTSNTFEGCSNGPPTTPCIPVAPSAIQTIRLLRCTGIPQAEFHSSLEGLAELDWSDC